MTQETLKAHRGAAMEGWIATWYAANTRTDQPEYRKLAARITADLPPGGAILEVAFGPGYLAIEAAKAGRFHVAGLDISESFAKIARANAAQEGVEVDFRLGNAASLPFDDSVFDRVVCRAAFKNFTEPVRALSEMRRVLKSGGKAVIADMRNDATQKSIDAYLDRRGTGRLNYVLTRWTFRRLVKAAYSKEQFQQFIAQSGFRKSDIQEGPIGFEIWLEK